MNVDEHTPSTSSNKVCLSFPKAISYALFILLFPGSDIAVSPIHLPKTPENGESDQETFSLQRRAPC